MEQKPRGTITADLLVVRAHLHSNLLIHELAKEMETAGFTGQGMRNPEQAHSYIMMAADNPNVEAELPEPGLKFWKACLFAYRVWQSRKKRGLPIPDAPSDQEAQF